MRHPMPQLPPLHDQPVLDLAQKAALAAALRQRDRRKAPPSRQSKPRSK